MKKFLKKFLLFILIFVLVMYFIGSCTANRQEYKPKVDESNKPVYTELTPEEYQKQMDKLIGGKSSLFSGFGLDAHASDVFDDALQLYKDFWEVTPVYNIYDYLKNKNNLDVVNTVDGHAGGGHYRYPSEDDESTAIINYEYDFYGKNRVVYSNGTYEIIECRILTSESRSDKKKTGVVKYTRTNQYYSTTSFSFDISVYSLSCSFNSSLGFSLNFYGLNSYTQGLTQSFLNTYLTQSHFAYFSGSNTNSIKQFNISDTKAVDMCKICYSSNGSFYPNAFSVCSTVSNDYEFSQSVNNYYASFNYWKMPNVYYNNNAGDIINQTNINNYKEYGYTYNEITNSIEFDPDIFGNYFNANINPQIEFAFDDVFSFFPEINAKLGDLDINYKNLVDVINEINNQPAVTTSSPSGTYPIVTGDINVTFPEEFYKKYPTLTTESAFVVDSPNIDYALDEPLPVRALEVSSSIFYLASDFISDLGLMPIALMCVSLCFISMFFL